MSTYVWMRILESAPYRYDLGIRLLSFGAVRELYERAAAATTGGMEAPRILEIGCGTANLTIELARRGAKVWAIDQNPEMLAQAKEKLAAEAAQATLLEMAAVEISDRFSPASFDAVVASLVLSEMSESEQAYVLGASAKLLRPGGRLVIADEVRPAKLWQRATYTLFRLPLAAFTYAVTQTATSPVKNLRAKVEEAGLRVAAQERLRHGSICILIAFKEC